MKRLFSKAMPAEPGYYWAARLVSYGQKTCVTTPTIVLLSGHQARPHTFLVFTMLGQVPAQPNQFLWHHEQISEEPVERTLETLSESFLAGDENAMLISIACPARSNVPTSSATTPELPQEGDSPK